MSPTNSEKWVARTDGEKALYKELEMADLAVDAGITALSEARAALVNAQNAEALAARKLEDAQAFALATRDAYSLLTQRSGTARSGR